MPADITIHVDDGAAMRLLAAAKGTMQARREINQATARVAAVTVRAWLLRRNDRSERSNYWSKAAKATFDESDANAGYVIIRHEGVGWHRWGGTISAPDGKAMAIPLRDRVRGVWPSELWPDRQGAFVYRSKSGKAFLATREGKALRILYLLVKSVSKSEDPTVLPPDSDLAASAAAAIRDLLRQHLARRMRTAS